jgi:hypothetical protein
MPPITVAATEIIHSAEPVISNGVGLSFPLSWQVVRVYRVGAPDRPATYTRGQQAEAEPALPGWRIDVDRIFRAA